MLYETVDRENVDQMVREFYTLVIQDEMVGPYFTKKLGEHLNTGKWPEHISTLDNFWLLMMNGQSGYRGNPFPPHAFIGKLYRETFERWLKLFHETVYRLYIPEIAGKFYEKAQVLAEIFIDNLDIDNDEE